ncbi:ATP-binding cassette domain-containing protein [Camelimonas sp. ID_303_24]
MASADAAMIGAAIRVDRASVVYRNGRRALDNATFVVPSGSITALVGVNGSGKSTLFKAIMGIAPLASGAISIFGAPVGEALRRHAVAYVPQSEDVDWNFPVLVDDVVMMGRYGHMGFLRRPRPEDREAVAVALGRVGMLDFRRRQIGELSGGQRKRVFLARALAQDARLILLDEPFTGVDVGAEEAIIALLRDLRAGGRSMLVSTHDLGGAPTFCDRAVLLNQTVLASGPIGQVFTEDNLRNAFGGRLRRIDLPGADGRAVNVVSDDERALVLPATSPDSDDPARGGPP